MWHKCQKGNAQKIACNIQNANVIYDVPGGKWKCWAQFLPFTCLLLWLLLLKNCHKLFSISSHLDYPDISEVVRQLFSVRAKRKWSFIISCFIMAIYSPNTFTCIVWQRIHFFQLSPAINPSWLYQQLLLQLTTKNKNLQHRLEVSCFSYEKNGSFPSFPALSCCFLPFLHLPLKMFQSSQKMVGAFLFVSE